MTTHKLNGKTILWVEVPDSYEYRVIDYNALIGVFRDKDGATKKIYIDVPKNVKFLSLSKDMTEEVAETIYYNFECDNPWCENGYIDMGYNEKARCYFCEENEDNQEKPLESFRSLEQSLGIDPTKNYIILHTQ